MASSSAPTSLLLLILLSLLSIGAHARPCKSLFISYAVSSASATADTSTLEVAQISATGYRTPSGFFAIYRLIPLRYYHRYPSYTEPLATNSLRLPIGIQRPALPRPVARPEPSFGVSSLRDRAKDILVVVAGLLFGVGCGALMSATMYLAWSLINNRYEGCGSDGFDYDDDDVVDVESPKKMGYADLLAAPATPVTPLKEGYEGN